MIRNLYLLFILGFTLFNCQGSEDNTTQSSAASTSGTSSGTGGSSSGYSCSRNTITATANVSGNYTLNIPSSHTFPIRIDWDALPSGLSFTPRSETIQNAIGQTTVQIGTSNAQPGTYDIYAGIIDSTGKQTCHQHQIAVGQTTAGGATGITPGPGSLTINGPSVVITADRFTAQTFSVPSSFTHIFWIAYNSDGVTPNKYINDQITNYHQQGLPSISIIPAERSFISLNVEFSFVLSVTVIDPATSQSVTARKTVRVCGQITLTGSCP